MKTRKTNADNVFLEPLNPAYCKRVKIVTEDIVDGFVFLSEKKIDAVDTTKKRKRPEPSSQTRIRQNLPACKPKKTEAQTSKKETASKPMRKLPERKAKNEGNEKRLMIGLQYNLFAMPYAKPAKNTTDAPKNRRLK